MHDGSKRFASIRVGHVTWLSVVAVAVLALFQVACGLSPEREPERPNVIFILYDDVGFSDFGAFGGEIHTPHIDQLASEGLRYNWFETRAICSPTRASLLTGRHNQAVGMMDLATTDRGYDHTRGYITPAAATIAQVLQMHGYHTIAVGKWHLTPNAEQYDTASTRVNWPSGKGFDEFYGILSGWADQYYPYERVGRELVEGDRVVATPPPPEYHFSEAIVGRSIEYIEEGRREDPDRPFFLYLSFGTAHAPIQVWPEYIERYDGVYDAGWDVLREARFNRQKQLGIIPDNAVLTPRADDDPDWDSLTPTEKAVYAQFMQVYAGMIEHSDEQIGRLVSYLKETDQYENTIIFVMSDNGAASESLWGNFDGPYGASSMTIEEQLDRLDDLGSINSAALYQRGWGWLGSTPFQRYKLWFHAGGTRTPLIVTWPKGISDRGGIRTQFVDLIDISPTVYDILNIEPPAIYDGVPQMDVHGESILQTFGDPTASTRSTHFFSLRGHRAIIHDGWKALARHTNGTSFDDDVWELYHLATDFSESIDLSAEHPEKLAELQALWWLEAEKYGGLPHVER